jgi:hypothetical protein
MMIPNAKEGTLILFEDNNGWFSKDHLGVVKSCFAPDYGHKYKELYSCVVVDDYEDDKFISSLNGGEITLVLDKNLIGLPNLTTFEHTIEWISMTHWKAIAKRTKYFCNMAVTHYNPYVINKLKQHGTPLVLQGVLD